MNSKSDLDNDTLDVEFKQVSKKYGDVTAVGGMDLQIPQGAFVSFLGPSGCGKTTSLRMIAGFEQPTSGEVLLRGQSVVGVPAYKRPVNMVFQHYALFPHLNVLDNIAYGVRQQQPNISKAEVIKLVGETLDMVRLSGYEDRRTWEMSGGQQQRVALARALINRPTVLLLDEPLAALDRKLRREMQIELQNLQREVGITFILVTHDQEEALSMSDTVCIMAEGGIVQTGSPAELYNEAASAYVAGFVGKSNFFNGIVGAAVGDQKEISLDNQVNAQARAPLTATAPKAGDNGILSVRPELIRLFNTKDEQSSQLDVSLKGTVKNRIFLGEHTEYVVQTEKLGDVIALAPRLSELGAGSFDNGQEVTIGWANESARLLATD